MLKFPQYCPREDCDLARSAEWQTDVLHVYNDNYLGIRAAASAMTGQKLVLPNLHWHYLQHLEAAVAIVRDSGCGRLVFHGMSTSVYEVVSAVSRVLPRVEMFGVWHGGPSQWIGSHEGMEFARFLQLDRDGLITRAHIMKPGCNGVLLNGAKENLVNCAPRALVAAVPSRSATALVPAPLSLHKNVFGNLCAAELCSDIDRVWHYADLPSGPLSLLKAQRIDYEDARAHQQRISQSVVVMNASTMDCHPMVDLEAAAVGRPSLHMALHLGVLDDHPLNKYVMIEDPGSIDSILDALDRVLSLTPEDSLDLCLDFAEQVTAAAISRMGRFLYA